MSTLKKSHVIYGYVRNKYKHNVPDVIIKMCLKYYNEVFSFLYKGKALTKLLSLPNAEYHQLPIKFNHDLSFNIGIAANGYEQAQRGKADFILEINQISQNIEQISICYQYDIVEIQSSIKAFTLFTYKDIVEDMHVEAIFMNHKKLHQQKQVTLRFHIHSLTIKYKQDNQPLYYPSLNSMKFQEQQNFTWNVDKKLIESFKDYLNGFPFSSPIFNNMFINCYRNGESSSTKGIFGWGLSFASFSININKMELKVSAKTNIFSERKEYNFICTHGQRMICCDNNKFQIELLEDKLVFDVEVIITKLYDLNDVVNYCKK